MKKICFLISIAMLLNIFSISVIATDTRFEANSYKTSSEIFKTYSGGTKVSVPEKSWMTYEISFDQRAKYSLNVYACCVDSVKFSVSFDGILINTGEWERTSTNWQDYSSLKLGEFSAESGAHTIRLETGAGNAGISLMYFTLSNIGEFEAPALQPENEFKADECSDMWGDANPLGDGGVTMGEEAGISFNLNATKTEGFRLTLEADPVGENSEFFMSMDDGESLLISGLKNDFYFPIGQHKLTISHFGDYSTLKTIRLNKIIPENATGAEAVSVKFEAELYANVPGVEGEDYHDLTPGLDATYYVDRGDDVEIARGGTGLVIGYAGGEWWKYNLTIPEAGTYQVTFSLSSPDQKESFMFTDSKGNETKMTVEGTGGWSTYKEIKSGFIDLESGVNQLVLKASDGSGNLDYVKLERINEEFELFAPFAGTLPFLSQGAEIPRGTDCINAYFSGNLSEEPSGKISLYNDMEEIPLRVVNKENKVSIMLLSVLDYSTEYTLEIIGVADEYGRVQKNDESYSFVTGAKENDEGDGDVEITLSQLNYEALHMEGIVYSSVGEPIAGRSLTLNYKNAEDTEFRNCATVLTDENGGFIIDYEFDKNNVWGSYSFVLDEDYKSTEPVSLTYISKDGCNDFLDLIAKSENVDSVKAVIMENAKYFDINPLEDAKRFSDSNVFFNHFVGNLFIEKSEFLNYYRKMMAFETLNLCDTELIDSVLSDSEQCTLLGIDKGLIDVIQLNRQEFFKSIEQIEEKSDAESFLEAFNKLTNHYLAKEYKKTAVTFFAVDSSLYVGKGLDIPVRFCDKQSNVSSVNFVLECDNENILTGTTIKSTCSGSVTMDKSQGKLTAKISFAKPTDGVLDCAVIHLIAPNVGTFNFKISGSVVYDIGNSYPVEILSKDSAIRLNVTSNSSSGGTGGGGGGGSTSQIGAPPAITPTPTPETESFEFSDMDEAPWAENSVKTLLGKNIISKDEDKKFYPSREVTRAEFTKMIVLAMGIYDEASKSEFLDVSSTDWYYSFVASAEKYGIVTGNDGEFKGEDKITRQDMSVMIYRTMKIMSFEFSGEVTLFSDDEFISDYARDAVYLMRETKIINGVGDNMFLPFGETTRAMAAKVIAGMMGVFNI